MGWANSVTLRLAGITNSTESPKGGTIVRSADGGSNLLFLCMVGTFFKQSATNLIHMY